ncbi:gliding motility lipoprotein GldB [Mucilaginibacter sp. dw_454]|uniref:gliding motility lipoprotein GldB n=1 Tax=Mucilaginibacter sp. dw_454 TaxID=2720079 RepID=UPI001BD503D6|nr:gliding motility lipoprotein GldB [Mucilaginibacter sp. dw_454]
MISTLYKFKQIYLIFIAAVLLSACGHDKKVDVSNIPIDVKIERFDHDFDGLRTKPMEQQAMFMIKKYGAFYANYTEQILEAGSIKDTNYFGTLRPVFAGRPYLDVKHDVDSIYPGPLVKQEAELTDAFRRIKYYYPKKQLPKMYAYFSGFKAQTAVGDGYFGIGLDLFLGAKSRFYPALTDVFPRYISRHFTPEYITPKVIEGIAREDMFPESDNDKTLLSKMVYNGKILYFMDQILPDVPDSTKIGYTPQQLKWCTDFKSTIWAYLLDQSLLYETDDQKITNIIGEAPFTAQLGNDSAPKIGVWTGWQIVKEYMDKHPEVTLPELMMNNDAQKILNESKYRPK